MNQLKKSKIVNNSGVMKIKAAAPEMFEVLQLIGTIANVVLDTDSDYKNSMRRISYHATEIIKKAKGE